MTLERMTPAQFRQLRTADPKYYEGRWPYLSEAIRQTLALKPKTALELGPYRLPLFRGSDVMDLRDHLPASRVKWKCDARQTPWPQADKSYDVFIALQVWEHLGDAQARAFAEVRRIARTAVLSFPYKWKLRDTSDCHHNVGDATISEWTGGATPVRRVVIDKPNAAYRRAIYVFDFR